MQKLPKVLLTEDDHHIASALSHALTNSFDIEVAASGKQAIYKVDADAFDLIILDLGLPDMNGLDVCQQIRERGSATPILILSADSQVMAKIKLLDAGANDYLTKPFSVGELKARMRNLVRHKSEVDNFVVKLEVGDLILDRKSRQVTRAGQSIFLRRKEFLLLECLMRNAETAVTRDSLTNQVWQNPEDVWTNTIDVHIKHLRDKIDRPFGNKLIKTVHGVGYKIETPLEISNPAKI